MKSQNGPVDMVSEGKILCTVYLVDKLVDDFGISLLPSFKAKFKVLVM
jgi:hypothetical protein